VKPFNILGTAPTLSMQIIEARYQQLMLSNNSEKYKEKRIKPAYEALLNPLARLQYVIQAQALNSSEWKTLFNEWIENKDLYWLEIFTQLPEQERLFRNAFEVLGLLPTASSDDIHARFKFLSSIGDENSAFQLNIKTAYNRLCDNTYRLKQLNKHKLQQRFNQSIEVHDVELLSAYSHLSTEDRFNPNNFDVLGLKPTLSLDDINARYHLLMQIPNISAGFQAELQVAYQALSNEVMRLTCFIKAADKSEIETLVNEWILKNDVRSIEIYLTTDKPKAFQALLGRAIDSGKPDVVSCLLQAGVSPNNGYEYLTRAVISGQLSILELLFNEGAVIKESDNSIHTAIAEKQSAIAHYLLTKGANANGSVLSRKNEFKHFFSFLARALIDGDFSLAKALIDHGAKVEIAISDIEYELNHQLTKIMFNCAINKIDTSTFTAEQKAKYQPLLQFLSTYTAAKSPVIGSNPDAFFANKNAKISSIEEKSSPTINTIKKNPQL